MRGDAVVVDTETTGLEPGSARVIEIAMVIAGDDGTVETLFHSYVNPECPIPEEITKITGITNEMVASAPKFAEIAQDVAHILSRAEAMIGQNPWFDRGMIAAELVRAKVDVRWPVLVCTKRTWDIYEPREQRHLTNAYKRFVDRAGFEGAHGALADATACARVICAQIREFGLQDKEWRDWDPEQKTWWGPSSHILWKDSVLVMNFGKHKDQLVHTVDRGFWRWVQSKDFPEHVKVLADYMTDVAKPDITAEQLASWAYGRFS